MYAVYNSAMELGVSQFGCLGGDISDLQLPTWDGQRCSVLA